MTARASLNLILLGPPGAGKGTRASRLVANRGMVQLSSRDMLRTTVPARTRIGLLVLPMMNAGGPVSDAIVPAIIAESMKACPMQTARSSTAIRAPDRARRRLIYSLPIDTNKLTASSISRSRMIPSSKAGRLICRGLKTALQPGN